MGDTCLPIEVVCTDPGLFSFFEESDRYEHGCHNHALHRAFSLVRKMGVRTLVREDLSADTETKFENEVIEAALGKKCKTASFRLSFFREPFDNECGITRAKSSSCLGYLIVVRIEPHEQGPIVFVKEALLEAPRLLHNYIHCTRRFKCRLAGRDSGLPAVTSASRTPSRGRVLTLLFVPFSQTFLVPEQPLLLTVK